MAALDFPNSPTVGATYTGPNGAVYTWDGAAWHSSGVLSTGTAAGGVLAGTYPNPGFAANTAYPLSPSGQLAGWTTGVDVYANGNGLPGYDSTKPGYITRRDYGASDAYSVLRAPAASATYVVLLRLDGTGQLLLPTNGANNPLAFGSRTIKGRLITFPTFDELQLTGNVQLNPAGSAWVQDDVTKPSWAAVVSPGSDAFKCNRLPAGGSTWATPLLLDASGNLTITGATATKASGTTWANPSDPRLKQDVAPYPRGLAEVVQLDPIAYRLIAEPDGPLCYGFDAAAVKPVFPECVSETTMKLAPDDAEPTAGVLSFDMHPILVALVTAVKELAAEVAALKAAAVAPTHA